jgi:uncharacterized protein YbjT (DUF2867 family)
MRRYVLILTHICAFNTKYMKTAIVLGATGLIGKQLTGILLESNQYSEVKCLVRKPLNWKHPKLREIQFNFDQPDTTLLTGDDLFCCIGTTSRNAGSPEAQKKVDYHYPLEIGKYAVANGVKQYLLVSSLGADAKSANFYLSLKGSLERDLEALAFQTLIAARPSILLGARDEFRLGEQIGIGFVKVFGFLFFGGLKKYRGIEARQVAKALVSLAQQGKKGFVVMESDALQNEI